MNKSIQVREIVVPIEAIQLLDNSSNRLAVRAFLEASPAANHITYNDRQEIVFCHYHEWHNVRPTNWVVKKNDRVFKVNNLTFEKNYEQNL